MELAPLGMATLRRLSNRARFATRSIALVITSCSASDSLRARDEWRRALRNVVGVPAPERFAHQSYLGSTEEARPVANLGNRADLLVVTENRQDRPRAVAPNG